MQILATLHCFGILLVSFLLVFVPSLVLSMFGDRSQSLPYIYSMIVVAATGLIMVSVIYWIQRGSNRSRTSTKGSLWTLYTNGQWEKLGRHEGFLLTTLFWCGLGGFGALPLMFSPELSLNVHEAVFESISGLTTTGATVITNIDSLSNPLLLYRQLLQWVGGIGLILIAIAIMPVLGIGGMQLYRAEAPGPFKDAHIKPRLIESLRLVFLIYCLLTTACAVGYFLAGMSLFDAICHSLTTVSIGGFSTHDSSYGYFADQPAVLLVACLFMVVSAISFALHFQVIRRGGRFWFRPYWKDPECQFFLVHLMLISSICIVMLVLFSTLDTPQSFIHGLFQAISLATTTGYISTPFALWPAFLPFLLFSFAMIGGCSGSTAGGLKAVRILLALKECLRELRHLIYPRAVIVLRLGNKVVPDRAMRAVWSFLGLYMFSFVILLMALLILGQDFLTAFYAVTATLNNIGPGLGEISNNYSMLSAPVKWVLCFSMLLGRLEILSLLVLLTPAFWKR